MAIERVEGLSGTIRRCGQGCWSSACRAATVGLAAKALGCEPPDRQIPVVRRRGEGIS